MATRMQDRSLEGSNHDTLHSTTGRSQSISVYISRWQKAATMLLIEGLEPDEQLIAKAASVFKVPFSLYELAEVYPRHIPTDA